MRLLRAASGNLKAAAEADFLAEVASTVRALTPAVVVECGSGLSTLVLGAITRTSSCRIVSLEQDASWLAKTQRDIARFRLESVQIVHAPLVSRGDFSWYSLPNELPDRIDVVVCDGPPGDTPGGRYGLVPTLRDRLSGSTILVDDANRPAERSAIGKWQSEYRADVSWKPEFKRGLAVVRMPSP